MTLGPTLTPGSPNRESHDPLALPILLLRRVFNVDVLRCEHCGGKRRLLALIQDPFVVRRILGHLGLPTEPTAIAPARASPEGELAFP